MLELASTHNTLGRFSEAESLYRQCLEIAESTLGPADPLAARAADGLGLCLANLGDYAGAEIVLRRGLQATAAVHGEHTGEAGNLMLNLGEVLAKLGKHAESTRLFRRAAEIMEEVYGPDHERYAAALSGLAHTKRRVGNNVEAEVLYRRAIAIVERKYGTPHPDLIHYRCRLGMTLSNLNRDAEGLDAIERGIAEAVEIYGQDSYQVAIEERHLGLLLGEHARWAESRSVLLRSLETLERFFGHDHPHLSKCLKALARASYHLDMPEEAHRFITRAVSLYLRNQSNDRTELTHLLAIKAAVELYTRKWDSAVKTKLMQAEIAMTELQRIYSISSTPEALLFAGVPKGAARSLVAAAVANPQAADSVLAEAFSYVAMTHGQVLDWLADRQHILELQADTTRFAGLHNAFTETSQRVADLVVSGPEGDSETYAATLAAARREMDEAEWAISAAGEQLLHEAGARQADPEMSPDLLAGALYEHATLIHFIRFNRWLYPQSPEQANWLASYGAFRLQVGGADSVDLDFIDLGPAASLDSLVFSYRRCIDGIKPGRRPTAREEADYRSIAGDLYQNLWAPLMLQAERGPSSEAASNHPPLIFLVPDSWLHLVDFNTLISPVGDPVIEHYRLHYLSSAGDLLRAPLENRRGIGLLAVGNPVSGGRNMEELAMETPRRAEGPLAPCAEAYLPPQPLPGAEHETRAIADLFDSVTREPVMLLLGEAATETTVKLNAAGRRMIHLATHGFYCEEASREKRPFFERVANSLFMSGLYLAPRRPDDDGLLTAYEVACLNLTGVDWVVLSACGSGLGRLIEGEGLFGLRRSFEIAGARTVVMAMWRIDDDAMRDLMAGIVKSRLEGSSTVDAVRRAQLHRLRDQRRRTNRIHPILWGGIVAEGDWR
jgi:CHAT domain-containing protein/tetratricopeptide (TPR) repeat protein